MSYMLDFPSGSLPSSLDTPPYVVFGINGTDITAMLPPRIPQNLVMHFAPALRKWVLPAPKLACLPLCFARKALRTPYVGIDIRARVDAVGLRWVIKRMLHLGCVRSNTLAFSALPDLEASVAIHNAWLTLELPIEGLRNLHTHIQAQLMLGAPPASLWDMRILWNTFPQASDIVQAMGSNFVQTCTDTGYRPQESLDIQAWIQSTPELFLFFKKLKIAMPKD